MAFSPARPGSNHRWRGLVTPARRGKGIKRECPGVQGELMQSIKRECPGVRCLFSLGRARGSRFQLTISRDATKIFVGIASGAPDRLCQASKVSKKDLQDQQCGYSPQALREPSSTISGSETIFWKTNYSRHPINTSYTFSCTLFLPECSF